MNTQPLQPSFSSPWRDLLRWAAILALALPYAILGAIGPVEAHIPTLLMCMTVAFTCYWIFCVESRLSLSSMDVLVLGVFFRILLLPMATCDDMYRYLWEGKIINFGFNPFVLPPSSPALAHFRDSSWALINHPDLPTLYPIVTEAIFAVLAKISDSALLFKCAFVIFDIASFLILQVFLSNPQRAFHKDGLRIQSIYFLNPLLILEIAGRGHFESIPIFFNVLFLWALAANPIWSPIGLIFGALSKLNSIALTPLLFLNLPNKKALAWSLIMGSVIIASVLASGMLDTLGKFTTAFRYNSVMPFFISKGLPFLSDSQQRLTNAMLLILCGLFLLVRLRKSPPETQALGFMGLLLLFSPTLHPWYFLWILPFAALTLSKPWLLVTGTILISYVVVGRAFDTGQWTEISWIRFAEYGPPLLFWILRITPWRKTQS